MMKTGFRSFWIYTGLSVLTLVFGMIYTSFSHGVTSFYMTYAFLPLAAVSLFLLLTRLYAIFCQPKGFTLLFLAYFTASLTFYMVTKGILDIAGANSQYGEMLLYAACGFGVLFLVSYGLQYLKNNFK